MNAGLAAVAIVVVAGAVVAVSAHEPRVGVLGLVLALVAAPVAAAPLPTVLPLAARMVAAVLAGYLLWVAVRGGPGRTSGSLLGWPVEAIVASTAAIVGFAGGGLGGERLGPPEATAAGFALAALAVSPLLRHDALQLGIGLSLAAAAAVLLRAGLGGTPPPLEQLATGGLVVAIAAGAAVLAAATIRSTETLDLAGRVAGGAHRAEPKQALPPQRMPRLRVRR